MLVLSTKDRDRLKVLHEVKGEHLRQRAAAQQLGISDRWVRKLLGRVRAEGDRGVVHRLRGQASKRRLPESLRTKALERASSTFRRFTRRNPAPTSHFRNVVSFRQACATRLRIRRG